MTSLDVFPADAEHDPARPAHRVRELLRLHPGARLSAPDGGSARIQLGQRGTSLGELSPGAASALRLLASRACSDDDLLGAVLSLDGEGGLLRLPSLLQRLRAGGWLSVTLEYGDRPLVTFRPLGPYGTSQTAPPVTDPAALRLSRFALLRRDGAGTVLESPLAHVAAELHDPALAALLASLPGTDHPVPWPDAVPALAAALARHGFLVPAEDAPEEEFRLAQWSPHELWFHSRTRTGRHDLPYGGTYWAKDRAEPLPAVREPFGGPVVELPRPDLEALRRSDRTLTEVLEDRRSVRSHDDGAPITLAQLGEFLFRSARNRGMYQDGPQQLGDRPHPSGGRAYELELYPLIGNVAGVAPGLYHYDPQGHRLELVAEPGPALARLTQMSRATALMTAPPQVALLVTARFGRVMWKYSSMGYALVLKHVGVLYQVMYSVATAMGLAACGLGGGDSDAFALASGVPWESESTVGEFLLGSRGEEAGRGLPA